MADSVERLKSDYLKRLKRELGGLPRSSRDEIVAGVRAHIEEQLGDGDPSEAQLLNVLERLGDPAEIAREGGAPVPSQQARFGAWEVAALLLLPFGALFAGIGWFVGVGLLWTSPGWTWREKLAGTLLPPGGLAVVLFFSQRLIGPEGESDQPADTLLLIAFVVSVILAIAVPIWLALRLRRRVERSSPT